MSNPEDIANAGKPRRRSRLFQAAPDRLLVDEWVPNIKLPPPPATELEDEGPSALLDEHGLPVREPEEEPEPERRGPARIYVGQGGLNASGQRAPAPPELQAPEMPDLRLPLGASEPDLDDGEESSSGDLPDLSIDGGGGGWRGFDMGLARASESDLEAPTDPNLRAGGAADEPSALEMPAAEEMPAASPPPAALVSGAVPIPVPEPGPAPVKPPRPTPIAPGAQATPSWARPTPGADRGARRPPEAPPRIRAAAPPRLEPSLASFVPRSLVIAIVVLGIVAMAVWAVRYAGLAGPQSKAPPAGAPAAMEAPTTVDGLVIRPSTPQVEPAAPAPEPSREPEVSPAPESAAVAAPEPAPVARPAPAPKP
ncbi:MAG: hypothetical protein ABIO70_22485, partial [Pseudomonadota bacterium]